MTSVWDDPELVTASEYVKFENVGDHIAGEVLAVQVHRWDDGTACPKLVIATDDGEEKALTASQMRLKAALAEQRPEAGDHISVTFREVEKRPGGKTLKHFDVTVTRGGAGSEKAAAPAPANPLDGLSPEQIAALAVLQAQQAK